MKHATRLPSRATTAASSSSSSSSSGTTPAAHRLSHAIAKAPPPPRKIRIVHVLAPEIIKTEARNFRDLVQRLTGKPDPHGASSSSSSPPGSGSGSCDTTSDEGPAAAAAAIKAEAETSSSGGGGYLRALEVEDGSNELFFQGIEDFVFSSCNVDDGFSF